VFPMAGLEVPFELIVDQGPKVFVPLDNDMASTAPIPAIGATFGHIFLAVQMGRPLASVPRGDVHFDIIHKIALGHFSVLGSHGLESFPSIKGSTRLSKEP